MEAVTSVLQGLKNLQLPTKSDVMDNLPALAITGAVGVIGLYALNYAVRKYSDKSLGDVIKGPLENDKLGSKWLKYDKYFKAQKDGAGLEDKTKAPDHVDSFYYLVTDIYCWGWGYSFHFSPVFDGMNIRQSEVEHERYVATRAGLRPGLTALDVGCGVGGPMRNIARTTGGNVFGITINDYQVSQCQKYNEKAGLQDQCEVVQGNFLEMPFEDNKFDSAYAIEATCHAPEIEAVYAEVFRTLKPGALFATYEWLLTPKFDSKNKEHISIIDSICHGNALPELRTAQGCEEAAKKVGFEVIESRDMAMGPCKFPWWKRLQRSSWEYAINNFVVKTLSFLRLAPKGTQEVHDMLVQVAKSLDKSGQLGIFTPMHLIVMKKPKNA